MGQLFRERQVVKGCVLMMLPVDAGCDVVGSEHDGTAIGQDGAVDTAKVIWTAVEDLMLLILKRCQEKVHIRRFSKGNKPLPSPRANCFEPNVDFCQDFCRDANLGYAFVNLCHLAGSGSGWGEGVSLHQFYINSTQHNLILKVYSKFTQFEQGGV